jgi:hypothetical protein
MDDFPVQEALSQTKPTQIDSGALPVALKQSLGLRLGSIKGQTGTLNPLDIFRRAGGP